MASFRKRSLPAAIPRKIRTVIAQLDQDLLTQDDVRKVEETNETQALVSKHRLQSQELAAAVKELAAAGEKMRAAVAKVAAIVRDHDRVVTELEARKQRPEQRSSGIMRECIGEVSSRRWRDGIWPSRGYPARGSAVDEPGSADAQS